MVHFPGEKKKIYSPDTLLIVEVGVRVGAVTLEPESQQASLNLLPQLSSGLFLLVPPLPTITKAPRVQGTGHLGFPVADPVLCHHHKHMLTPDDSSNPRSLLPGASPLPECSRTESLYRYAQTGGHSEGSLGPQME